jgi:hypothetical protein
MREKKIAYRLLVRKPGAKRLLGKPRSRWVDNIRMDLGEVGWGDVDWIGLVQDRDQWRAIVTGWYGLDRDQWRALVTGWYGLDWSGSG